MKPTKEEIKLNRLIEKGIRVFDSKVFSIPYASEMYKQLVTELYYEMKKSDIENLKLEIEALKLRLRIIDQLGQKYYIPAAHYHNGSPCYQTPCDQYSLGLVLFELLTGTAYKRLRKREIDAALAVLPESVREPKSRPTCPRPHPYEPDPGWFGQNSCRHRRRTAPRCRMSQRIAATAKTMKKNDSEKPSTKRQNETTAAGKHRKLGGVLPSGERGCLKRLLSTWRACGGKVRKLAGTNCRLGSRGRASFRQLAARAGTLGPAGPGHYLFYFLSVK